MSLDHSYLSYDSYHNVSLSYRLALRLPIQYHTNFRRANKIENLLSKNLSMSLIQNEFKSENKMPSENVVRIDKKYLPL